MYLVHFAFISAPPNPISIITVQLSGTEGFLSAYLPFLHDSFLGKTFHRRGPVALNNLFLHLGALPDATPMCQPTQPVVALYFISLAEQELFFQEFPSLCFWVSLGHKKHFVQGLGYRSEVAVVLFYILEGNRDTRKAHLVGVGYLTSDTRKAHLVGVGYLTSDSSSSHGVPFFSSECGSMACAPLRHRVLAFPVDHPQH